MAGMSVDINGLRTVDRDGAAEHRGQIRSRDRVRDLAEVYTHRREVDAMLDLVPDMFPSPDHPLRIDRKFFEPACGSGNFLEEILHRKTRYFEGVPREPRELVEYRIVQALASIYAIDINQSNVDESRNRLASGVDKVLARMGMAGSVALNSAVDVLVRTNILCADTLKDAPVIRLIDYVAVGEGAFLREWSRLDPDHDVGLFALFEVNRDAEPVHFSQLHDFPSPTPTQPFA